MAFDLHDAEFGTWHVVSERLRYTQWINIDLKAEKKRKWHVSRTAVYSRQFFFCASKRRHLWRRGLVRKVCDKASWRAHQHSEKWPGAYWIVGLEHLPSGQRGHQAVNHCAIHSGPKEIRSDRSNVNSGPAKIVADFHCGTQRLSEIDGWLWRFVLCSSPRWQLLSTGRKNSKDKSIEDLTVWLATGGHSFIAGSAHSLKRVEKKRVEKLKRGHEM